MEVSNDILSFERYCFEEKSYQNSYRMQIFTVRAQLAVVTDFKRKGKLLRFLLRQLVLSLATI
jgi:hypothetical protein